jgi:hypothetical protein
MLGGTFRGPWVACCLTCYRGLVVCAKLESSHQPTAARTLRKPNSPMISEKSSTIKQPGEFGEIIDIHQSNWVGQWRNEWQSQKLCRIRYRAGG